MSQIRQQLFFARDDIAHFIDAGFDARMVDPADELFIAHHQQQRTLRGDIRDEQAGKMVGAFGAVVFDRFAAAVDGVRAGGLIAQKTVEGAVLLFAPIERVGRGFEQLGFDVGHSASGALENQSALMSSLTRCLSASVWGS